MLFPSPLSVSSPASNIEDDEKTERPRRNRQKQAADSVKHPTSTPKLESNRRCSKPGKCLRHTSFADDEDTQPIVPLATESSHSWVLPMLEARRIHTPTDTQALVQPQGVHQDNSSITRTSQMCPSGQGSSSWSTPAVSEWDSSDTGIITELMCSDSDMDSNLLIRLVRGHRHSATTKHKPQQLCAVCGQTIPNQ